MAKWLYSIGSFAARRAWAVIAIWVLVIAGVAGSYSAFHGQLKTTLTMPGTETQRLTDELAQRFPDANRGTGQIIVKTGDGSAITEEQKQAFVDELNSLKGDISAVDGVLDPFATEQQIADGKKQLEESKPQLEAAPQQIADGKKQLEDGQKQLDDGKAQLEGAQKQLDEAREQAQASGALESMREQLGSQQGQLDAQRTQINETQKELDGKASELAEAEKNLPNQQEEFARKSALLDLMSGARMVSEDGSTAAAGVFFKMQNSEIPQAEKDKLMEKVRAADLKGLVVNFDQRIAESPDVGMGIGEIIGIAVALITLIVMLGTLIAAGLPIIMALVGVIIGILGTLSFSTLVDMSSTTYMLGMMLGLAVGIDYSLFILNRHRSNLMDGMPLRKSIAIANGTSGNAVVFAGATVIIALLALNVTGIPFLGYMGDAAALCVFVAVLISVTLTPAMLSLIGRKVMSKKAWASVNTPEKITAHHAEKEKREATPHGWLRIVLAKPVVTILLCVAALGAIAIPMGQMRMGLPSAESSQVESTEYQAYQIVKDKFGEGMSGPVVAVAHTPAGMSDAQAEQAQLDIAHAVEAKDPDNVKTVVPIGQTDDHTLQIFQVIPKHGSSSVETVNLVEKLRQVDVNVQGTDVRLGVTGLTGGNIDVSNTLAQKLPLYLAVVMGLSFIVLILVFRSILVPLVASIGFLFSILASFGAVVAVYQMGFMGSLFGVHDPGPILAFLPTLMIGILFGLAMDYQVFLVSGMREAYVHGKDAKTAVVAGYNHAVRVVVAAMIIMISVFGGFIFAESSMIRPIGFGLAFGVLVDAFVVRMTITPAIMSLLGEKAWWMPKWLDKLVPNMDVEGATLLEELEHKDSTKTSGIADLTSDIDASNIETPWAKKKTE